MKRETDLWTTHGRRRYFLIPQCHQAMAGNLVISNACGGELSVAAESIEAFEIAELQAVRWARSELGVVLENIRDRTVGKLTEWRGAVASVRKGHAPSAERSPVPAFYDLLKSLPAVVGNSLSGEPERLQRARARMTELASGLRNAGIDVDSRVTNFPERVAGLRADLETK